MFSFILENFIAARNQRQHEDELMMTGELEGVPSRQSDYMLNKFSNIPGVSSSVDVWSRNTMSI